MDLAEVERRLRMLPTWERQLRYIRGKLGYKQGHSGVIAVSRQRRVYRDGTPSLDLLSAAMALEEKIRDLKAAVECLDKQEQEFIHLRYLKGLTMQEIAEAMGYGLRTVFKIRRKTLENLGEILKWFDALEDLSPEELEKAREILGGQ